MADANPIDGLTRAITASGRLIALVGAEQWSNRTPCPDFDVRALVNHLVFGKRLFTGILNGDPLPAAAGLPRLRATDWLGDDPLAAHNGTGEALLAAFARPGVLERVFAAPIGSVPGAVLLHLRVTEELVHGWDLACATAQPAVLPEDLAEQELAFSRSVLDNSVPRAGRFGEPQDVPDSAPAIDRLAAFLGRTPAEGMATRSA